MELTMETILEARNLRSQHTTLNTQSPELLLSLLSMIIGPVQQFGSSQVRDIFLPLGDSHFLNLSGFGITTGSQKVESQMNFRWSIGARKTDKSLTKPPAKGYSFKPRPLPDDLSPKDEFFFYSQPWLESDWEEYFSVYGDFTPSRGNTPICPSNLVETSAPNKSVVVDRIRDGKKQLSELFRQNTDEPVVENFKPSAGNSMLDSKSIKGSINGDGSSPYACVSSSHCSSEGTPNRFGKQSKERTGRSTPCCFSTLGSSFSFIDKKKRFSSAQKDAM